jgi:hypothetical protein
MAMALLNHMAMTPFIHMVMALLNHMAIVGITSQPWHS